MTHSLPTKDRRALWVGVSLLILFLVLLLTLWSEDTVNVAVTDLAPTPPVVTVVALVPAEATAEISAFAQLDPRWKTSLRSAVSGRVTRVFDAALAGSRVEAGAALFAIEKSSYRAALAAAELSLEESRLGLWQAEQAVALAEEDFRRTNTSPPNDYALRLPQLRIAKQRLDYAVAQQATARQQFSDTDITAPFLGIVTKRWVSLGQTVSVGDALLELADTTRYELSVELNESQWGLLSQPISGTEAAVFHRNGARLGTAIVREAGGFLVEDTRQRRVFLTASDTTGALLAGDFVRIELRGRTLPNTLRLPESALTRSGYLWLVDAQQRLQRVEAEVLFRSGSDIVVNAPTAAAPVRIALSPLASFLPGQVVSPRVREG